MKRKLWPEFRRKKRGGWDLGSQEIRCYLIFLTNLLKMNLGHIKVCLAVSEVKIYMSYTALNKPIASPFHFKIGNMKIINNARSILLFIQAWD